MATFSHSAAEHFSRRLISWVQHQPELRAHAAAANLEWCNQTLDFARSCGVNREDTVARFARLRLLRGDDWLASPAAREITSSDRDDELKVFQLECLHWGVTHG